eukprot:m.10481 g.10481  ORF g.10481 m.10481 type:complete len:352 (-) comp3675_c0_seq1:157-1212(-)
MLRRVGLAQVNILQRVQGVLVTRQVAVRSLPPVRVSFASPNGWANTQHRLASTDSDNKSKSSSRFWNLTPIYERVFRGIFHDGDVRFLASRTAAIATYAGAGSMILGTLGVDMSAVIAGLSVGGLSIGFASRDIVSNYMSGLLLIASKPFQTGDEIIVGKPGDNIKGIVSKIDLRYLHLRCIGPDSTAETILIPNSEVFKSIIHSVRKRVSLHEGEDAIDECSVFHPDGVCGKLKLPMSFSRKFRHVHSQSNAGTSELHLQPLTPEFQRVVNLAFEELNALEERSLRQRLSNVMFEVDDSSCQKVILWLASEGGKTNMYRPEWAAFLDSISSKPSWLPQTFIPEKAKENEE